MLKIRKHDAVLGIMLNYIAYAIANKANLEEWFYIGSGRTFDPGRSLETSGRIYGHLLGVDRVLRGENPLEPIHGFLAEIIQKDGIEIEFLILVETDLMTEARQIEEASIQAYCLKHPGALPFNKARNGFWSEMRDDLSPAHKEKLSEIAKGTKREVYSTFKTKLTDEELKMKEKLYEICRQDRELMNDRQNQRLTRVSSLNNQRLKLYRDRRYEICTRIRKKKDENQTWETESKELQELDQEFNVKHRPYVSHDWITRPRATMTMAEETAFLLQFIDPATRKLLVDSSISTIHREYEKKAGRPFAKSVIYSLLSRHSIDAPRNSKYGFKNKEEKFKRKMLIGKLNLKIQTASKYELRDVVEKLTEELNRVLADGSITETQLDLDSLVSRQYKGKTKEVDDKPYQWKEYVDQEVGPNRTVFLLIGASGSGKSWVGNKLENQAFVLDADKIRGQMSSKIAEVVKATFQEKPILFQLTMTVSSFLKHLPQTIKVRVFAIIEPESVIHERLIKRGSEKGVTDGVRRRMQRIESLGRNKGEFSGGSQAVLEKLLVLTTV